MTQDDKGICLDLLERGLKNSLYYLQSGQKVTEYMNIDETILGDPSTYEPNFQYRVIRQLADQFAKKIREIAKEERFERMAFIDKAGQGPVGMIALSALLVLLLEKEAVYIRPSRRIRRASIRGRSIRDKERFLIVSDVATTGETILKAADRIWNQRGLVAGSLVFFDNELGAKENLMLKGIRLFSLITRTEAREMPKKEINIADYTIRMIHEFGAAM